MNDVLEDNVARLLRAAYRPVQPSAEARERLRTAFLEALDARLAAHPRQAGPDGPSNTAPEERHPAVRPEDAPHAGTHGRGPRARDPRVRTSAPGQRMPAGASVRAPRRRVRHLLVVLALALLAVALRVGFAPGTGESSPVNLSVARWRVAGADVDSPWRTAPDPFSWDGSPIELRAGNAPLTVRDGEGRAVLLLGAASRATLAPADGPARRAVVLEAGGLLLHARGDGWLLGGPHGGLWLSSGDLRVGPVEPGGLRLELLTGRATTTGFAGLPVGGVVHLDGGRLILAATSSDGILPDLAEPGDGPGSRDRTSIGPQPADGAPGSDGVEPPSPASLQLTWTGDPVDALVVWLREEVPLPQVSQAVRHVLPGAGGTLEGLLAGEATLVVEPARGAPLLREHLRLVPGEVLRLEVGPVPSGSVRGHVVDAASGAPVRGARVLVQEELPHRVLHAQGEDLLHPPLTSVTTDDLGAFHLPTVSAGRRSLLVLHPDHAPAFREGLQVEVDGTCDAGLLELGTGAELHGRVLRGVDRPSVGTEVVASRVPLDSVQRVLCYGGAVTEADGSYRIPGLAPGVYVVLDLGPDAVGGPAGSLRQVVLEEGQRRRIDFGAPAEQALRGTLLTHDGRPVVDVHVTLTARGGGPYRTVPTDPTGAFLFEEVPPGAYDLHLTWEGRFGSVVRLGGVELEGDPRLPLELRVPAGELRLQARTPAGAPLPEGLLLLEREDPVSGDWDFLARLEHPEDGTFELRGLPPGRLRGTLTTAGPASGACLLAPFDPFAPQGVPPVVLEPGGSLELSLRDGTGRPVADARVQLALESGARLLVQDLRTDEAGLLVVPCLPAATWQVLVRVPQDPRPIASRAVVRPGETCELRLSRP